MDELKRPSTIVIVDDVPENLDVLQQMLQDRGHRILLFTSADPALKAASRNPPDLFLLDINMPGMDGFEMCRRLKADPRLSDIPVLFISGLSDTENKVKAFSIGGVDYVTKPFQIEEVHARVEAHLHIRWMRQELERHSLYLEDLVAEKVREISESQLATIGALANLAESRDDDTGKHIERTRFYCRLVAETLAERSRYAKDIDEAFIRHIFYAAPLHDIGKVAIPDNILLKPGKLSFDEFEVMKTHAVIGERTLRTAYDLYPRNRFLAMGIEITRSHHEKWDGSGYPDGLKGEAIPLSARIMAVADVYDALRSRRPYKEPFTHVASCAIIRDGAGKHFDPVLIEAFEEVVSKFDDCYRENSDTDT